MADDEEGTANAVEFRNAFRTSELALSKLVVGDGVELYSTDEFLLNVVCVDADDREVFNADIPSAASTASRPPSVTCGPTRPAPSPSRSPAVRPAPPSPRGPRHPEPRRGHRGRGDQPVRPRPG
ncbi:hypothetical protein G7085_16330 [Tessaracoccus sp. HDW20]|uniref:hypothetical protein n=1 Tax=Tessaracoccus coleopterorum TaxID=2714950 RepID=UPI0018D398E0|nr:hypothetical protein [Tessaracoccus coleopterorum]NHB85629.1 hypothetical protein [Tessaracoccus coleopterorum]